MEATIDMSISEKEWAKLPILGIPVKNEKEEKHLRELINCEFLNSEEPGLSIKFPYGDTRNHRTFQFFHGGKYRIPRFLQRHINSRATPIWKWKPDGEGSMRKDKVGNLPRFQMHEVF